RMLIADTDRHRSGRGDSPAGSDQTCGGDTTGGAARPVRAWHRRSATRTRPYQGVGVHWVSLRPPRGETGRPGRGPRNAATWWQLTRSRLWTTANRQDAQEVSAGSEG